MALVSEGSGYSSPSKRIKLDKTQHLSNSGSGLDFGNFTSSLKNIHDVTKETCPSSSEVLNSGDSGFNDLSPLQNKKENCNELGPSLDNSMESSKSDDERTGLSTVDDDKDEVSSTVSNLSDLSGLSELSGQDWKPTAGPMSWVQKQMLMGANPRGILSQLMPDDSQIPAQMDDLTMWKIIVSMLSEPPCRQKLRHVNTIADVVRLLRGARRIVVLTGAGVSVSCGIPDFRSRDGIYSRLAMDFPNLPDPQAMFDIQFFSHDPRPFFKFAREIYPGQFKPSPCHRFIKLLEKQRKLLRNYTQNIDTLEQVAGIENVIECHGSFATASCMQCRHKVTADEIRGEIFAQTIPVCKRCSDGIVPQFGDDYRQDASKVGVMKPDIVFFGEGLPERFHDCMAKDKDECDLLIVVGSSLKVRPVALIPSSVSPDVPQILINREPLPHFNFDVELLGDSDVIINQLCHMLGEDWKEICWQKPLNHASHLRSVATGVSEWQKHSSTCRSQSPLQMSSRDGRSHDQSAAGIESEADSLQMSIDSGMSGSADSSCSAFKERHMSVDSSTRDSGLCLSLDGAVDVDGSVPADCLQKDCCSVTPDSSVVSSSLPSAAQADSTTNDDPCSAPSRQRLSLGLVQSGAVGSCSGVTKERRMSVDCGNLSSKDQQDIEALRDSWRPQIRQSLATRLPEHSYYFLHPNRYIFPGAEVYCDADDDRSSWVSCSSSSSSDSDSRLSSDESGDDWEESPPEHRGAQ
ncbi:NAD-dependent protein deacetylase sirtuin-1 [Bacillus rossius redtenbacheri]|uniref:NAD-dependent protein deacetylase sirtuin-1 n=1 Tax=Bacillus rossius redtenbacheri TaxID=93214 RepID=UPI002FDE9BE1